MRIIKTMRKWLALGFLSQAASGWAAPASIAPAAGGIPLWDTLAGRVREEPFHAVATAVFLLAIIHTFLAPAFERLAHRLEHERAAKGLSAGFLAGICHFMGEVEAIFGLWVVPLMALWVLFKGWPEARDYLEHRSYAEPVFVVAVMAIAASRPVVRAAEALLGAAARLGGGTAGAWWLSILILGPLLGSLITEPAAMTISALLLSRKFFDRNPGAPLAYATLGLLFVNVSVGGTLTHFAAPPVLMVSGKWDWNTGFMLAHFGWKAALASALSSGLCFAWFRKEFAALNAQGSAAAAEPDAARIPPGIILASFGFLFWVVVHSHSTTLVIGGLLLYLAFAQVTQPHQSDLRLRPALMVGLFLAGLVVHGGLQGWWIEPVLQSLGRLQLFWGATFLTAFNDNAAVTYLASQAPEFSDAMKYAVVAGAVTGGGLTVIANAPNPAGQSILAKHFAKGVSPLGLFLGALLPTAIVAACFLLF